MTTLQKRLPQRVTYQWNSAATYVYFILFTVVVLLPVYWLVRSALASAADLNKIPPIYFPTLTLQNFRTLINQVPFWDYTRNSVVFALATTLATLVASFLAAYAFARIHFPGSGIILWVLVLSMALPDVGTIVPLYRMLARLQLLDTIAGLTLVLSSTLTPFTVWVLVSFIKQVPYEIEEAAILDGATLPQIFWRILIPLTAPGLVTMGLINFVNAWNNLLYPLSFSVSPSSKTLSVAITEVFAGYSPWGKPWELISAVGVTMVIPIVLLVLFSQKAIVRGLTGGALK
ncbi:MAG: carbohydrate ABC transporter permease [Chloroflexi bacterium]|nr:carbohydrate ABC transporter permease [Chloroflexota bacterium]MCI0578204.1 carbohydrate ABC transporter permease [Chloroflexota bacterium]MCI0645303.1 carbohydrate ABC transporter permease [Chloroflexota bacterium]MCI0729543.1 carbohydrate ABC transporter permease [Chloroflexota bacterium]